MRTLIVVCLAVAAVVRAESYYPETPLRAGFRRRFRITNGYEVEPHLLPYQVAVVNEVNFCGGSLVTKRYVLTAAHCYGMYERPIVIMGAHRVNDHEEEQVRMKSKRFYKHEEYFPLTLTHDLALVELPEDAPLNEYIQTVRLVRSDYSLPVGTRVRVSGWGRVYEYSDDLSTVLRAVESTVISNEECQKDFKHTIQKTVVCIAGAQNRGTCNGDSGGPLVLPSDQGDVQVGIVSFGSSAGCEKGFPSGFTRLTEYRGWIDKNTGYQD